MKTACATWQYDECFELPRNAFFIQPNLTTLMAARKCTTTIGSAAKASTDATRLPNIHRKCKHFPVKVDGKSAMVPNSMARHVMKLDPWHAVIIKQFYFTNVIKRL